MNRDANEQPTVQRPTIHLRTVAVLLGTGLLIALLAAAGDESTAAVGMFGRTDVLACALVFAAPLAMRISSRFDRVTRIQKLVAAAGLLLVAAVVFDVGSSVVGTNAPGAVRLALWRGFVAVPAMTGLALACHLLPSQRGGSKNELPEWSVLFGLAGLALLVPAVYADAIADGVQANLRQSLENQRLALAYQQSQQLQQLKPSLSVQGTPVERLVAELREAVDALQHEASAPLPDAPSLAQRGRRITVLVQLERNEEALRLVEPLTRGERFDPIALDYYGLCCQRLQRHQESLRAYQRAVRYWESQPDGAAKSQGLASALKGIGFAARKLEIRTLEEEAYRGLVQVSPTAESHFLLAQCYREHQKAELAAEHAGMAMQLDPVFSDEATTMLSTLSMDHFGCLQIPRR